MADTNPGPAGKLCPAPPQQIPHEAHTWHEPDLTYAAAHPAEPMRFVARYCDGWAALLPGFLNGLSRA